MKEPVIVQDKIAGFFLDPRSIFIRNLSARKIEVVDRNVAVGNKNSLAVWDQTRRDHFDPAADPLQGDVFIDRGIIVGVGASVDINRVAVLRSRDRSGNGRVRLSGTNS